jgi:hypothetical protein
VIFKPTIARQPQGTARIDPRFGRAVAYLPSGRGLLKVTTEGATSPALLVAGESVPSIASVGRTIRKTGSNFFNGIDGIASGAQTYESGIVVIGESLQSTLNTASFLENASGDIFRIAADGFKIIASSSERISQLVTIKPGEVLAFQGRSLAYAVWHRGVKYTDAGGFGGVTLTSGIDFAGQSIALLVLFPDSDLADSTAWSLCDNPWQVFATLPRRMWAPSVSGVPVLSAATVTAITQTTATPRVTINF